MATSRAREAAKNAPKPRSCRTRFMTLSSMHTRSTLTSCIVDVSCCFSCLSCLSCLPLTGCPPEAPEEIGGKVGVRTCATLPPAKAKRKLGSVSRSFDTLPKRNWEPQQQFWKDKSTFDTYNSAFRLITASLVGTTALG